MSEPRERAPRVSMRPSPPDDLRAVLRRELAAGGAPTAGDASVARVIVEVRRGERGELVTLGMENGRALISATDAVDGAMSPATRSAIEWLLAEGSATARASIRPAAGATPDRLPARLAELSAAIVRSGVEADGAASVRDALPRLIAELPSPPPVPVARWLGRLTIALAESDARQVARLLSRTLGDPLPWPFVASEQVLSDRRYVELGREVLDAYGGAPIERRVLCDDERGDLVVEERYVGANGAPLEASIGPCPRMLDVGLGMLRDGAPPQLRAQQYTLTNEVSAEAWDRIEQLAVTAAAAEGAARADVSRHPGAAEPLSLIAAPTPADGELVDGEGHRVPLSREDPGAAQALVELAEREPLRWVLVRWACREAGLSAVPLAAAHRTPGGWRHVRLR